MLVVKKRNRLLKLHRQEINQLLEEQYENAKSMTRRINEAYQPYYMFYQDQQLVGLFFIMDLYDTKMEGYLWGKLYQEDMIDILQKELAQYEVDVLMLISTSKEEIITAKQAQYQCSEYLMLLTSGIIPNKADEKQLTLCPYQEKYQLFYHHILSSVFEMEEEQVAERLTAMQQDKSMNGYILLDSQKEPVGFCGCYVQSEAITLFDIAILPEYRCIGYGSGLLCKALNDLLHAKKKFLLQVCSDNSAAVHLYQKFGFVCEKSVDYFAVPILKH